MASLLLYCPPAVGLTEGGDGLLKASGFNVVVVRADGRRVRRLGVARWVAPAALVVGTVAIVLQAGLLLHYATLRHQQEAVLATQGRLDQQARALAPVEQRLAELRDEIIGWERLHAAIWKPLGPDRRPAAVGIGGPSLPTPGDGKALGDEMDALLAHVREETRRLRALARMTRETASVLSALPSRWPLRGALNSAFGPRLSPWTGRPELHAGIDIAAAPGTPVKAPAPGVVRFAGAAAGYGNTVLLDHGAGVESRYGHLQTVGVTSGQRVEQGQPIGLSGNTGRSTAPHLHYEVIVDGKPVDPRRLARE